MRPNYNTLPLLFNLFAFVLALLLGAGTAFSQTSGPFAAGTGAADSPYQISTIADLNAIRDNSDSSGENYLDDHFVLTSDLDFDGFGYADPQKGWLPLGHDTDKDMPGFDGTEFTGTFDADGHVIRNLMISREDEDFVGVFGSLGSGGTLKNLGVEGQHIRGDSGVGGIVGRIDGTVNSCYSKGAVTGNDFVGGLAGQNLGQITSCYAMGTVTGGAGSALVGGVAGLNFGGTISTSYWDMDTSGTDISGGGDGKTTAQMKALTTGAFGANDPDWDFGDATQYPALSRDETVEDGQPYPWTESGPLMSMAAGTWPITEGTAARFTRTRKESTPFAAGTGAADSPYQISTIADLNAIRDNSDSSGENYLDDHFVLTSDLDFANYTYNGDHDAENAKGWLPIGHDTDKDMPGFDGTEFTGTFDAGGHVIRNLMISREDEDFVGVFGSLGSGGTLKNLGVEGQHIRGDSGVGGIVGRIDGTVNSSYSKGAVTGNDFVGGLAGQNLGQIISCYATGTVTGGAGSTLVGGVVGLNFGGAISTSYWDMDTSGTDISGGGDGKTTAQMKALTTGAFGANDPDWDFGDATQYPALSRDETTGAGQPYPRTEYEPPMSMAAGTWPVMEGMATKFTLGRFLRIQSGFISFAGGTGAADSPYRISTIPHLNAIRDNSDSSGENYLDDHFVLTRDLDFADYTYHGDDDAENAKGWLPIGHDTDKDMPGFDGTEFTGTFDGDGHVIRNLMISREDEDFVGVFGSLGSGGTLKNLGVEGQHIRGDSGVGGIVGRIDGTVNSCYSKGAVTGNDFVGGLAGQNLGQITSCYATGTVTGEAGSTFVGGVAGLNFGGTISTSYWDTDTSGTDISGGGDGKTTAQMKALTTGAFGANDPDWNFGDATQYPALSRDETMWAGQPYPRTNCGPLMSTAAGTSPVTERKGTKFTMGRPESKVGGLSVGFTVTKGTASLQDPPRRRRASVRRSRLSASPRKATRWMRRTERSRQP